MILTIDLCTGEVEMIKPPRGVTPDPVKPTIADLPYIEPAIIPVPQSTENVPCPFWINPEDYS